MIHGSDLSFASFFIFSDFFGENRKLLIKHKIYNKQTYINKKKGDTGKGSYDINYDDPPLLNQKHTIASGYHQTAF